ncbi:ISAs1 family transposase [Streptomyces sp. NPDC001292]|uniref:ISAs1 family transposase n=1 Tax=Streptomyces sp. NPDC001292 TaxID=3364558 RepID=UPI003682D99C
MWAADAPDRLLLRCGATLRDPDRPYRAPSEATVRRVLQRIDGDTLDAAIGGWLTASADACRAVGEDRHLPSRPVRAAVAVDGKSVRGAICADGRCVHLLSALRDDGIVLAQREVDAKSNEITAFRPLLDPLDLTGAVVTFDALLTQTDHAKFLVEEKDAHYIAVLKGNHPTLQALVKDLPWKMVPLMDRTWAAVHGRDEIRRLKEPPKRCRMPWRDWPSTRPSCGPASCPTAGSTSCPWTIRRRYRTCGSPTCATPTRRRPPHGSPRSGTR